MDNILIETLIFALLIFFAGFLTSAEIAISSIGENKIDGLKEQKNKVVHYFEFIQKDSESFYGSIQLLFTLTIILSAIIGFPVAIYFVDYLLSFLDSETIIKATSLFSIILAVIVITFFILVFCLLIPKAIGYKYSSGLAIISVKPLFGISKPLKILVKALTATSNLFLIPFKEKTNCPGDHALQSNSSEGANRARAIGPA